MSPNENVTGEVPGVPDSADFSRSRKYSVYDGATASLMSGAGDTYFVPLIVALHGSASQIGFVTSFVGLLGAASQLLGSRLVYRYGRRSLVVISSSAQAALWLVLVLVAWRSGWVGGTSVVPIVPIAIGVYVLAAMSGSLGGPAWFSLLGDIVDEGSRGRFFSRRNRISGSIAMVVALAGAWLLDAARNGGVEFSGFAVLFTIACGGRFMSSRFLSRHADPPCKLDESGYFSFLQFIREAPRRNFGRFSIYVGLIQFATAFSAPFFAVWMLRHLNYSYVWFSVTNLSGGIYSLLSLRLWGRLGDRYGNRTLLWIGSMLIPFPPLFWMLSGNPVFLILTGQLLAGAGWAAFNLAATNFIYDSVTPQRRAICVAYYTMLNGIGVFLGAGAGGLFAQYVRVSFMQTIPLIFLVSGLLRMGFAFGLLRFVREVRESESLNLRAQLVNQLYLVTPRPIFGMIRGVWAQFGGRVFANGRQSEAPEPSSSPQA